VSDASQENTFDDFSICALLMVLDSEYEKKLKSNYEPKSLDKSSWRQGKGAEM
jgi:hypothetical protein